MLDHAVIRAIFALIVLASLAGCYSPHAPPSAEFVAVAVTGQDRKKCPDLTGTYRLQPGAPEYGFFSPYQLPPHQMDMVQLRPTSEGWYRSTLKMDEKAFLAEVNDLRESEPARHAAWREQVDRWLQAIEMKRETSVAERDILELGPLPARGGLITPKDCDAGWMLVEHGSRAGERNAAGEAKVWDTEIWLAKSAAGALLFRHDTLSTASAIFGGRVRTGLVDSRYAKLEPASMKDFTWSVEPSPVRAAPEAAMSRVELSGLLVDIQAYLLGKMPSGGQITYFAPDTATQAAIDRRDDASATTPFWLEIRGTALRNADVHVLANALEQHERITSVELESVRQLKPPQLEFGFRVHIERTASAK